MAEISLDAIINPTADGKKVEVIIGAGVAGLSAAGKLIDKKKQSMSSTLLCWRLDHASAGGC